MNSEQFSRQLDYGVSMSLAREMLKQGIISRNDYTKIDQFLNDKHKPVIRYLPPPAHEMGAGKSL